MDTRTKFDFKNTPILVARRLIKPEWLITEKKLNRRDQLVLLAIIQSEHEIIHSLEIAQKTGIHTSNIGKLITSLIKKGALAETPDSPFKGVKNGIPYKTRIVTIGPLFEEKLNSTLRSISQSHDFNNLEQTKVASDPLSCLVLSNKDYDSLKTYRDTILLWSQHELSLGVLKNYHERHNKLFSLVSKLKESGCSYSEAQTLADFIAPELTWAAGKSNQKILQDKKREVLTVITAVFQPKPTFPKTKYCSPSESKVDHKNESLHFILEKPKKIIE